MNNHKCFYFRNTKPDIDYNNFSFPEDMKKIVNYLRDIGTIEVPIYLIERLYKDFSDNVCASWLKVDDNTLEDFAEYLSKLNIEKAFNIKEEL